MAWTWFFRGDTRTPEVIKRDGFDLWPEAKAVVAKEGIVRWLSDHVWENRKFTRGCDISDWVRVAKDHARPTISASWNQGCGGYDSDYVYKFRFDGLEKHAAPHGSHWKGAPLWVYRDGLTLDLATTIALDLGLATQEVVFFTKVPPANITSYRSPQGRISFMSGVAAAPPAGPKKLKVPWPPPKS
jgi:hypothetical protein